MPIILRVLLTFLGLLAPLIGAQAQPATLSGVVTQNIGGTPATGVTVEAFDVSTFAIVGSVVVDPTGAWLLSVPAGSYRVRAVGAGFVDEFFDDVVCDFGSCNFFAATQITLTPGALRNDVNFALDATGSIAGTVRRESDNTPLPDVLVFADSGGSNNLGVSTSAADGSYSLEVPAGQYLLFTSNRLGFIDEYHNNVSCPGGACDPVGATLFDVVGGASTTGIDFALARGGTLSGRVLRTNSQPIDASVTVQVVDAVGSIVATSEPDASGVWAIATGLLPGSYRAVARPLGFSYAPRVFNNRSCPQDDGNQCDVVAGDAITISVGNDTGGIDFVLPRVATSIAGRVTRLADGSGFEGVEVLATRSDGQFFGVVTDAAGDYHIEGISAGSYQLHVTPPFGSSELAENWPEQQCFGPAFCAGPGSPIVLVAGEDRLGVDLQLAPPASVSITLRNADNLLAMRGLLKLQGANGSVPSAVSVNAPEAFVFPVLNGGPLRFAGTASECGAASDRVCLGERFPNTPCPHLLCDLAVGTPVNVAKGSAVSAELVLVPGASVSGLVTESAGPVIADLPLEVVTADNLRIAETATDSNGDYRFDGLDSGPYWVRTRAPTSFGNEIFDNVPCPNGTCSPATGTALALTLGQTLSGIDFALARGAGISGTLRSAFTTQPIPGATVAIYDAGGVRVAQATSAADGGWLSPVLVDGSYTLTFEALGFETELYDNLPCPDLGCDPSTGATVTVSAPTTVIGVDADLQPLIGSLTPRLLYLNRCLGGCTVLRGIDDSRIDRSSIVDTTSHIAAFEFLDPAFEQLAQCVRSSFVPYLVDVTTVDPGSVPHFEMMIGGVPGSIGRPMEIYGVAPWAGGSLIPNAIAFVFAEAIGNDPIALCYVTGHEAGHLMGLDHEMLAADFMSYLQSDIRSFVDAFANCGELSPRSCNFNTPTLTQNTHRRLLLTVGQNPLIFDDGFETPLVPPLPPFQLAKRTGPQFSCGFDGSRISLPPAIYFRPSGPTVDAASARADAH